MSQRIGQQVGTYRLLRVLGEGGFATVYLGEHLHLETLAALKLLTSPFHVEQPEPVRLFQSEVTRHRRTSGLEVATVKLRLGHQVRREVVYTIAWNPRAGR